MLLSHMVNMFSQNCCVVMFIYLIYRRLPLTEHNEWEEREVRLHVWPCVPPNEYPEHRVWGDLSVGAGQLMRLCAILFIQRGYGGVLIYIFIGVAKFLMWGWPNRIICPYYFYVKLSYQCSRDVCILGGVDIFWHFDVFCYMSVTLQQ